ncbi:FtsK/SpoIIIE domain-containing protein [Actinotalea subterranea]|uniref:FtsK/SpoIIIE domain-containing protein n=1 Tax=Actinotalea subterranea TaxID=2607497 RepID=UPI0011EC6E0B|nr:FtsK/SpoIIIE domain-containing protein [Actinotalea subterranea]
MRFTLDPGGDVEIPDAVTLGQCRDALVRLTGRHELRDAPLSVDGRALPDDHVAGAPPWVEGSRLRLVGCRCDRPGEAGRRPRSGAVPDGCACRSPGPALPAPSAPWYVSVLAGPDAGLVAAPDEGGIVRVGRTAAPPARGLVTRIPSPAAPSVLLPLSDPEVSREHAVIAARSAVRRGRHRLWRVRDLGSANGTHLRRGHRARPRHVRAGDRVRVGGTTLVVHVAADAHAPAPADGAGPSGERLSATGLLVPLATSAVLALLLHNPLFLVLALAGPLAMLAPRLSAPVTRLVGRRAARARRQVPTDVAAAYATAPTAPVAAGPARRRRSRTAPFALAPDAGSVAVSSWGHGAHPNASSLRTPWWPLAREGLVVVGADHDVRATARALVGAVLVDPAARVTVVDEDVRGWAWCRWSDRASVSRAPAGGASAGGGAQAGGGSRADGGSPTRGGPSTGGPTSAGGPWGGDDRTGGAGPADGGPAGLSTRVGRPRLAVAAGTGTWRSALDRWWIDRDADDALLLLAPHGGEVPAWCRWVLHVTDDPDEALLVGPRGAVRVSAPMASLTWAEEHARRLLAAELRGRASTAPAGAGAPGHARGPGPDPDAPAGRAPGTRGARRAGLPDRVALADLGLPSDVDAVLDRWRGSEPRRALTRLATPVGVARSAPADGGRASGAPEADVLVLDLLADGPHALVAGTTGAGKSELLQSWILGLALVHPPGELAILLVDYKGGASFGACRDLPHVVGQVTDLDAIEAGRALDGLRAELRRREELLAAADVGDLEQLRARTDGEPAPPRLLVVVDEFRAFTEDLPDFVPGLVRVAAQGRSLGIHLVLATQRPAGAVSAQMRANISLRVCLRVADAADSTDVVDVPDAAHLPSDRPGRAVVRRGALPPEVVQTAWAALPGGAWHAPGASGGPVLARWVEPFVDSARAGDDAADGRSPRSDGGRHLVDLVRAAADVAGCPPARPVWLPPLPSVVSADELPAPPGTASATTLPFGLTDRPQRQTRAVLTWDASAGCLVVAGRPGSGRTTTLRTLAHAALERGWHVHAVLGAADRTWSGLGARHPGIGTVVDAGDPRRLARLLVLLAEAPPPPPTGSRAPVPATAPPHRLLVVDDLAAVRAALDRLPRGAGADLLDTLLRDSRQLRLGVAVAGGPHDLARLLAHAAQRWVLAVNDPHDAALLGVPASLALTAGPPGRGVNVGPTDDVGERAQVALPAAEHCPAPSAQRSPRPSGPAAAPGPSPAASPSGAPPAMHVAALPEDVPLARLTEVSGTGGACTTTGACAADTGVPRVPVGRGGDDAGVMLLDVARGALVVGPGGSGRSAALATIALGLRDGGSDVLVAARSGPLADVGRAGAVRWAATPAALSAALAALRSPTATASEGGGPDRGPGAPRPTVVVVDDLDLVAAAAPEVDEALAAWIGAAEGGDSACPRVVAAARTDRAASAYRGALAGLRWCGTVLVLSPTSPGSADLAGVDLSLAVDPARPRMPGRGVVVDAAGTRPVQVARPPDAPVSRISSR